MSQETSFHTGPMLLTFLAGAAVGAVVVALTTPKSGAELRKDLKNAASRARRRTGDMLEEACGAWDELKDRAGLAVDDLKHGASSAPRT